jgi:hypothetical protein
MNGHFCFHYQFYPVGQGLFAAGSLRRNRDHQILLRWVYDCGSVSGGKLIDAGLANLRAADPSHRRMDLVTLSHFDNDHISGVVRLLGRCPLDILLIPYLPLWQRLIIAFEEGVSPTDEQMLFFINPVEYLATREGSDIRRIVLVLPSGENGPPFPAGDPDGRGDFPPDAPLEFDAGTPDNDPGEAQQLLRAGQRRHVAVAFLGSGGAIRKRGWWEFVPYNDARPATFDSAFLAQAAKLRDALLYGISASVRTSSLRALKKHYEAVRRPGPERNDISLFLYAGPIYTTWQRTELLCRWRFPVKGYLIGRRYITDKSKCSILYPGDGFLDTAARLNRLTHYLGATRTARIGILQVMHHGAELNCHDGVAARFAPKVSVFSSDPNRKPYHPHKKVLDEFSSYGRIQVDKERGLEILGRLGRKFI